MQVVWTVGSKEPSRLPLIGLLLELLHVETTLGLDESEVYD
jgi:hypothetical protein